MIFYFDIVSSEVQRASMDTKKKIMDALKNRVVNIWREKLSNIFEATYNFYGKEVNFTLEELFSSLTVTTEYSPLRVFVGVADDKIFTARDFGEKEIKGAPQDWGNAVLEKQEYAGETRIKTKEDFDILRKKKEGYLFDARAETSNFISRVFKSGAKNPAPAPKEKNSELEIIIREIQYN